MDKSEKPKDIYADASTIKEKFKNLTYEAQIAMSAKVELLQELEIMGRFKADRNDKTG